MRRWFLALAISVLATLALGLGAPAPAVPQTTLSASQRVPDAELLRWVYVVPFPPDCAAAQQVAAELRVKPTADPSMMHKVLKEYAACLNAPAGQRADALANSVLFGSAAAALLAARREPMPAAVSDAYLSRDTSKRLVDYNGSNFAPDDAPAITRTNAHRMNVDAIALIAALPTGATAAPTAVQTPPSSY